MYKGQPRTWLISARNSMGLTQQEVADRLGITKTMYYCLEQSRKNPSVALAKNIGELMSIQWTKFYEEE